MVNILIVEDETPARNSLKQDVATLLGEDSVIRTAANGLEALEIIKDFPPHILLTDIRMPHMLGTQLAEKVLDLFPRCKIIFLSGYSDKHFLKLAIKIGVIDYIEKPIDTKNLKVALDKATAILRSTSSENQSSDKEILNDLFRNNTTTNYNVFSGNSYFAAALILPCTEYVSQIITLVQNAAKKSEIDILCHKKHSGVLEILFMGKDSYFKDKIDSFFNRLFLWLEQGEKFKCVVGSIEKNPQKICVSYQNAALTTDLSFFYEANTTVFFDDITLSSQEYKEEFEKIANNIYQSIINGNYNDAVKYSDMLYKKMQGTNRILSASAKQIYYKLSDLILRYYENFFSVSRVDNISLFSNSKVFEFHLLTELNDYLFALIETIRTQTSVANSDIVQYALLYLDQNYNNANLSISDVVRFCHANANYLCSSFKKTTGQTINHYINMKRIEAAKKFLIETSHKVNDISDMCGFNDSKYFCRVFRKYTSFSPSDYRRKHKKV